MLKQKEHNHDLRHRPSAICWVSAQVDYVAGWSIPDLDPEAEPDHWVPVWVWLWL